MAQQNGETEKRHPIQVVARRTGLTADVLRVWEKRYAVVEPGRSEGGRRLYSDADVERLRLLNRAASAGRRISRIAELPTDELRDLVREDERQEARVRPTTAGVGQGSAEQYLVAAWQAVEGFEPAALEASLTRAGLNLSAPVLIDEVVAPLLQRMGERWAHGELSPGHEHLASATVRLVLERLVSSCAPGPEAPSIVVATPSGQVHEFGALFVAAVAAAEGWRVLYLGTDLPGSDIAHVADQTGADAIALSIVFPSGSAKTSEAIRELAGRLRRGARLAAGGASAGSYAEEIRAAEGRVLGDLRGLREWLGAEAAEA